MTTPPSDAAPLTSTGLANLTALAHLMGYVRYFHPTQEVEEADWDAFAIGAVEQVETAPDAAALAQRLQALFGPIAPTVRIEARAAADIEAPAVAPGPYTARWVHHSAQQATPEIASRRVTDEPDRHRVTLSVPFALDDTTARVRASVDARVGAGGTGGITLVAGPSRESTQLEESAPTVVELVTGERSDAQDGMNVGVLLVELRGRTSLDVESSRIEVASSGADDWRPLDLTASEFTSDPPSDAPLGWDIDMTVPYAVTRVVDAGTARLHVEPVALPEIDGPLRVDLPGGVGAVVPLALPVGEPVPEPPPEPGHTRPPMAPTEDEPSGSPERSTRVANVLLLWPLLQHFYPYFDVVECDWDAELRRALVGAATADDVGDYLKVLRSMLVALHDGHAMVFHESLVAMLSLPLSWEIVEGELVVTSTAADDIDVVVGDVVTHIEGSPALDVIRAEEALVSGTPQWKRTRALWNVLAGHGGPAGYVVELGITTQDGGSRTAKVGRVEAHAEFFGLRPEPLADLAGDTMYIDICRLTEEDFEAALPRLHEAKGIVVDLRGYPQSTAPLRLFRLLTDHPITSPQFRPGVVAWPNRKDLVFERHVWLLPPQHPRITAPVAYITAGSAISAAETMMAIVEAYGLATIVGAPTAGANGNIVRFSLPGGFVGLYTGTQVLKPDGSIHHTVGIVPHVPVTRTRQGVREGRDEFLERAIEVVSQAAG